MSTFNALVIPLQSVMRKKARSLTKNDADADDLVQECLLRAFRHWGTFKEGASVKNWLLTIVTNEYLTQRTRRQKEDRKHDQALREDPDCMAVPDVTTPDTDGATSDRVAGNGRVTKAHPCEATQAIAHSLPDEIERSLDGLTPEYRSVVERCDLGDDSYKEAAATLGIPIGTVMSRLSRGRQALRKSLLPYAASLNAA